jgi:hypothetical protein
VFERFTTNSRRVIVLAQEEARRLQHNYIGTEHELIGRRRPPTTEPTANRKAVRDGENNQNKQCGRLLSSDAIHGSSFCNMPMHSPYLSHALRKLR